METTPAMDETFPCPNGHENPPDVRYCGTCGAPLAPGLRDPRRKRRVIAGFLVVLTCIGVTLSTTGAWARRAVTDTDRYVSIVGPLIDDPAVQAALADRVTDAIFQAVDIQSVVANLLPDQAQVLAAPITSGIRSFVEDRVLELMDSEAISRLWVSLNTFAHEQIVAVLRNESSAIVVNDDEVALNTLPLINATLQAVEDRASGLLGRELTLPSAEELQGLLPDEARARIEQALGVTLPADFGQIVVLKTDALASAQELVGFAEESLLLLVVLTIVLLVASLLVSVDKRRTIAQLGLGSFLGLLVVRRAAIRLQDDVAGLIPARSQGAARSVVSAFLDDLRAFTTPLFVLAALIAIGAFVWGKRERIVTVARELSVAGEAERPWVAWVREHVDVLRIAGAIVAVIALFMLSFSWLDLVIVGGLLAVYLVGLSWLERTRAGVPV